MISFVYLILQISLIKDKDEKEKTSTEKLRQNQINIKNSLINKV